MAPFPETKDSVRCTASAGALEISFISQDPPHELRDDRCITPSIGHFLRTALVSDQKHAMSMAVDRQNSFQLAGRFLIASLTSLLPFIAISFGGISTGTDGKVNDPEPRVAKMRQIWRESADTRISSTDLGGREDAGWI